MNAAEVFAAAVLIACDRGLNLSPIANSNVPQEHEPGVVQLNLDKPRRGPGDRFWPEIFVDEPDGAGDGDKPSKAATTVRLIAEATEPARQYSALQGKTVPHLLVFWPASGKISTGLPAWKARANAFWVPQGTRIDFVRLRRSVPGRGVAKEPTNHSPETYLDYVRSDPESLMEQREGAVLGIQKLMDHARARLAIRSLDDKDAHAETDALLVNCSDPSRRPDTGRACTTGFYSFLDCLECPNAGTVPRLLPRQMAAKVVLEELRDSMGCAWERKFARHYYTLIALEERHTEAERHAAANEVERHIPTIVAALRYEVPK